MKRRILLVAATIIALITACSCTAERADHRCGKYHNGKTWAKCDSGRCCSLSTYCGDTYDYCNSGFCEFQCHDVPIPLPPLAALYDHQSNHELVAETGGSAGGGGVVLTRLVNATYNNNHYLNLNSGGGGDHDHGELVKVAAADNASSSSSSSSTSPLSSSFLSCARSLNRLPLASRYKYPFAALRAPQPQNSTTATTRCGRCLKVTNLGVGGGVPNQVKVRIAHEHNKEGLELDFNAFKKLDIDGSGTAMGRILVKYQFDSC